MDFKIRKEDKTVMAIAIGMVTMLVTLTLLDRINAELGYDYMPLEKDVAEDEVIVCINGNVIGQAGNICKVFLVDGDGYFADDVTLKQVQEDLYQNPDSDTFQMDVRD